MSKLSFAALPALALLAACGGDEIVTTNTENVVTNEALENYAFVNDGEMSEEMANEQNMMNMADPMMNGTMDMANDGMMMNGGNAM